MILPASQGATLALLVISLICWGSWANTLKLAGRWRFELYYYDFALGFAVLAVVAAFTGGSLNSGELTFQDNFLITGYRNMAYVIAAGIIFNLGNMLLAATIAVAGMALAFTITFATALVVSTAWFFIFEASNGFLLSLCGAALLLAALVMGAAAYSNYLIARSETAKAEAAKKDAAQAGARAKRTTSSRPRGVVLAVALGVAGGIALGLFRPLLDMGSQGESGVAPYGVALLFAAGILVSTVILNPFFFNFPVAGDPIGLVRLFQRHRQAACAGIFGRRHGRRGVPGGNAGARRALGYSNRRHAQLRFEPGGAGTGRGVGLVRVARIQERGRAEHAAVPVHVDPAGHRRRVAGGSAALV